MDAAPGRVDGKCGFIILEVEEGALQGAGAAGAATSQVLGRGGGVFFFGLALARVARGNRVADMALVRCSGSVVLARRGLGPAMPLAAVATGTSLYIVGGVSWAVLHEPLARL